MKILGLLLFSQRNRMTKSLYSFRSKSHTEEAAAAAATKKEYGSFLMHFSKFSTLKIQVDNNEHYRTFHCLSSHLNLTRAMRHEH